jgi:hypothetical protein
LAFAVYGTFNETKKFGPQEHAQQLKDFLDATLNAGSAGRLGVTLLHLAGSGTVAFAPAFVALSGIGGIGSGAAQAFMAAEAFHQHRYMVGTAKALAAGALFDVGAAAILGHPSLEVLGPGVAAAVSSATVLTAATLRTDRTEISRVLNTFLVGVLTALGRMDKKSIQSAADDVTRDEDPTPSAADDVTWDEDPIQSAAADGAKLRGVVDLFGIGPFLRNLARDLQPGLPPDAQLALASRMLLNFFHMTPEDRKMVLQVAAKVPHTRLGAAWAHSPIPGRWRLGKAGDELRGKGLLEKLIAVQPA